MQAFIARAALLLTLAAAPAFSQTVAVIGLDTLKFESSNKSAVADNRLGDLSAAIARQLQNDLLATRKFKVLDYAQSTALLAEYGISVEAVTDDANTGTVFDTAGIDYVLRASVNDLTETSATLKLDLFSTSEVLDDVSTETTLQLGGKIDDLAGSVTTITAGIVNETVANVFPVRIMGTGEEGLVQVNYGKGLLKVGDKLTVFSPVDLPRGGAVEGGAAQGPKVATIEIVRADTRFSSARIIDGEPQIGSGLKAKIVN